MNGSAGRHETNRSLKRDEHGRQDFPEEEGEISQLTVGDSFRSRRRRGKPAPK